MWKQRQESNPDVDFRKVLDKLASIIKKETGNNLVYKSYRQVSYFGSGLTWSNSTLLYSFTGIAGLGHKRPPIKEFSKELDKLGIQYWNDGYSISIQPTYGNILISGEHTYG